MKRPWCRSPTLVTGKTFKRNCTPFRNDLAPRSSIRKSFRWDSENISGTIASFTYFRPRRIGPYSSPLLILAWPESISMLLISQWPLGASTCTTPVLLPPWPILAPSAVLAEPTPPYCFPSLGVHNLWRTPPHYMLECTCRKLTWSVLALP